ncbi:MAG: 5'-deoxynucleotidase [Lachnospiraceae bacterium]|nr:5'-deoxynucleotidase [Lachnospiraceae bacterium]
MFSFFAMLSRMKYIDRWALMRNSRRENICEHSHEVAVLAHALAVIGNERLGKHLPAERAAVLGLYHDSTEIITGDLPTPVKYKDDHIRRAYKHIESQAARSLLARLPEDLRGEYESLFVPREDEAYLWELVKAADKLSALIKCIEEEKTGNREFILAGQAAREKLEEMPLPELKIFLEEFLPAYSLTLDEMGETT